MKKITFLLLLTANIFLAKAQQPLECGKYIIDNNANELAKQYEASHRSTLIVNNMVRVYFYIVSDDNGSNAAATPTEVENEFNQMVNDYAPNNLCFANMGFRYIRSTNINNNINCDNPASYSALNPWLVPNCITVFFQQVLNSNSGNGYGGNAYAIPNTFCSVATGNINQGRTTSHEVGHCLGLLHTFEPNNGFENINGSNCATVGDQVCDTPSDPWARGACFARSGCNYTGNCVDANGASNFSPPYNNIMSYWWLGSCVPNNFTVGQFTRLNSFLSTNAGLISTLSNTNVLEGPSTYNSTYGMISAINALATSGAVLCTNNCVVSMAGRKVTLNPGFRATPTTGKITIRGNFCFY
jgi:Pregnancy-associated plasma protein-A